MSNKRIDFIQSLPFKIENDPISEREYKGYKLAAPQSFWDADQDFINEFTGGCGPGEVGSIGDRLIPDTIYCLRITLACQIHDWTYAVWNSKEGFELANNLFKNNMQRMVDQTKSSRFLKWLRYKRLYKYYWVVKYFGETSYFDFHLTVV